MAAPSAASVSTEKFRVGVARDLVERAFEQARGFSRQLGRLETRMFHEGLKDVAIVAPVYVTGLARSGTTLLLEILASSPETVSHRYKDYPGLRCPILWQNFLALAGSSRVQPVERAHQDGIMVTPESPEAFEEILWMDFFADLHDPSRSNVLDARARHPQFEAFYRDHIRKLMLASGGRRYLAKGNYNVARLEYLLSLFPDARFVVPIRDPVSHVGSLMRQQRSFTAGQSRHPRSRAHLRRIGHFEFGMDRRVVNFGDLERTASIEALWSRGEEVRGWARYWSMVYDFVYDRMAANMALRAASLLVRYDALCANPAAVLRDVVEHVGLSDEARPIARAAMVRPPKYYDPGFTDADLAIVEEETHATASRFGLVTGSDEDPIGLMGVQARTPFA